MANSIEDLYQQYAGRAPDPEGAAFWGQAFGSTIDPDEIASFQKSVAEARAQGTEPAAQTPTFTPTATVEAPLSMQSIANTPGLGAAGIGVGSVAAPASSPLSPVEQMLVSQYGWTDNGDGTLTTTQGYTYDTEGGGLNTSPRAAPEPAAASTPTFTPAATVEAPLSLQPVANIPELDAAGIGVNVAPVINATREQVLSAYANNPLAELNPSEEAINYWMSTGIGDFNSVVDQVRAENPALAASIDASRSSTGGVGALDQVTGNTVTTGADVLGGDAFTGDTNTTGTTGALSQVAGSAATGAGVVGGNTAATTGGTGATALNNNHVIALGDSTTYGYNAGNRLDTNMVSSAQTALGSNYTIDNLGVNSTTVGDLLSGSGGTGSNWANTLASDAGVVVLNYGLNEAYRGEDQATFAANLTKAVNDLRAAGKSVILQTPNIVTGEAWTNNVDPYVNIIRSVAAATGSVLDDKYAATGAMDSFFDAATGDTIHPSSSAYAALGVNLANVISGLNAQRASTGTGSAAATGVTTGTANDTTAAADTTTVLPGALAQVTGNTVAPVEQAQSTESIANAPGLGSTGIGLDTSYGALGDFLDMAGIRNAEENAARLANQNEQIQELYTQYMGPGRIADQEGLSYWRQQFGLEIDDAEREQFRQTAAANLMQQFGEGDAGLLGGFKYAKDLGVDDASLKSMLGDDLYNQYKNQLKTFATTGISDIVADNSLTFAESQQVANFARDLGFTSQQLADLTGKDKSLFDTILTNYDTNRNKIINDTLTGENVLTDADRVVAAYALEKQFGFTDEELSQATGVDVDVIKNSLNPVRNFETDFSTIANNTDSTTQQIKDFVADAKSNPAIAKLYGDSLSGYENKIAELEQKWSRFGSDPVQSENLFQQLNAQKEALGGQYYQGAFGDLENAAAQLVQKGLDSMGDLGQKDKFQPAMAEARYTTLDGRPVVGDGAGRFGVISGDGESQEWTEIPRDQVNTVYGKYVGSGEDFAFEPLSTQELETLKDGVFQQKLGSVVIDKDTGKELTGLDGNLLYQRTGGHLKGRKHYLTANFTDEGVPYLTASQEKSGLYAAVSDLGPMVISIASVIPGPHQPFAMAANAALALEQKNYLGAVLSGLGAYGTFTGNELATLKAAEASGDIINASQVLDLQNTAANVKLAQTAINGISALQQENLAGVINASLSAYGQTGGTLPSGATTALQAVNLASAIESGNVSSALVALGDLTGSKDLHVAASAKNLIDAIETGNISNIAQAGGAFANSFQAANQARETTDTGGITNRITDDMTEAGAAAFADAKRAGASDADALAAANALTTIAEANETFDGSGFDTQNAAMNAAIAEGLDKFTFGGKTFTIDNSAAQIRDFENSVAAEVKAANDLRAKSDPEFGDLAGAQAAATARNTVAIGNTEADNPEEAAYLAKVRDPSATSFTFDGKTYTISASQSQMAEANRTAALAEIRDIPNFNDAFARARDLLGPGQTFPWFNPATGKVEQKSTATAAERPDLSAPKVQPATDESAAETARLTRQNTELLTGNAPDQSAAETTRLANLNAGLKSMEKTSFLGQIYKDLNEQFRLQGVAANEYLKNNPNSPITESVSSAFEAAGELSRNLGGAVLALDNKPLADAIIKGGERLQAAGQSIGSGPQDTKNWKDTIDLIDKAKGFEKVAVIAGRIMDGTSGLARQVELELRQELPALFLGGGLLRPTLIASGLIDTADTGGAAVIDAYEDVVKKGGTHQEGLLAGRKAGAAAAATEAAIQLTLGKLGDFAAGKLDDVLSKGATKIGSEGVVEGSQEAGASAAVDLALGNAIDINKALTQGVLGAAVGKGTATATSGVDAAQTDALNQTASNAGTAKSTATDLGAIGATRPGEEVVTGGDLGSIGSITPGGDVAIGGAGALGGVNLTAGSQPTVSVADAQQTMADLGLNVSDSVAVNLATQINNAAASTSTGALTGASAGSLTGAAAGTITAGTVAADISSKVTTQIGSGADAASVVGSTITSSLGGGADAATVINSSVTAAINAGGSASTVVGSSVAAAVTAGANTASTVESAVTAAVNAGSNVSSAVDSAVTAAVNAGGNVNTAVGSSVAAAINSGANVTTAVDSAVTAAANAGTSVDAAVASSVAAAINTGADVNTAVTAAVNAAVNAGNNITVATNANVTTVTNATTNTTTNINTNTGVATTVNANTNVTTTVDASTNTTTVVDANTNTTTQTKVDANANTQTTVVADTNANTNTQTVVNSNTNTTTSTTVDTNTNTTTQTTTNANTNTQTTVVTDTNTNTQTTIKVNTETGDLIEQKETKVPDDWKPPVIEPPVIPPSVTPPPVTTTTTPPKEPPTVPKVTPRLSDEFRIGSGGVGLPVGMDLNPASLRSRETQKAIDPLARVKEIQAEFEREAMIQNVDPRLMQILQQRADPQQQSQQFDKDIGALAKLLGGTPDAPSTSASGGPSSNASSYYSYGSEDSIDDILGGKAANYKEGGFVEPLKASGGSMALPLLAKAGGALGHYQGRENFKEGKHVAGKGDGQSDDIPAWLADGEFVFPADVVSALGNGSTKAGTDKLYEMMHGIRDRARSKGPKDLPPPALKSPLDYLKSSKRSTT